MEEEARTLHRNGLVGSQMKKTAAAYVMDAYLHLHVHLHVYMYQAHGY